jgi:hypothetical protein
LGKLGFADAVTRHQLDDHRSRSAVRERHGKVESAAVTIGKHFLHVKRAAQQDEDFGLACALVGFRPICELRAKLFVGDSQVYLIA